MLHLVQLDRTYSPETLAIMGAAFDAVWQSVAKDGNHGDRRMLALVILQLVDRGECDPDRLADAAFCEWMGTDRPARRESSDDRATTEKRSELEDFVEDQNIVHYTKLLTTETDLAVRQRVFFLLAEEIAKRASNPVRPGRR